MQEQYLFNKGDLMKLYLIEGCYGEYDDFNRLPLMVVSDKDTANMVCEELCKPDNMFMPLVKKIFGYVPHKDIGWSWDEIEYFSLV